MFQACPDFKGIKTRILGRFGCATGFKLALISKGLRLPMTNTLLNRQGFKLALISKGLRLPLKRGLKIVGKVSSLP